MPSGYSQAHYSFGCSSRAVASGFATCFYPYRNNSHFLQSRLNSISTVDPLSIYRTQSQNCLIKKTPRPPGSAIWSGWVGFGTLSGSKPSPWSLTWKLKTEACGCTNVTCTAFVSSSQLPWMIALLTASVNVNNISAFIRSSRAKSAWSCVTYSGMWSMLDLHDRSVSWYFLRQSFTYT